MSPLVTQILKMMTEIDDEDDWAQQDEAEDVASDVRVITFSLTFCKTQDEICGFISID